jgi:drug/metabolite transporter (DMT)-like permease
MTTTPQTTAAHEEVPASGSTSTAAEQSASSSRQRARGLLALLAVYLIWGSTYLAIRFAIESIPPFLMLATRFLIAGGVLYLFLRLRGAPAPGWKQWAGSAAMGTLLLAGGLGVAAFAEQWVASGLVALAAAAVPLWTALFAGLWGQWPARREWIGLAIGFLGVGLLNLEGGVRASPLGAVLLLIAPISWAFGSVWSRRLPLPSGLMSSATEMLTGGAVLLVLGLALGERVTAQPTGQSWLALGYLVIFGSLVAFSAYGYLLRSVRPALATSYAYVNPVVAIALGVGLDSERITWIGGLAMLVILAGVMLVALRRQ